MQLQQIHSIATFVNEVTVHIIYILENSIWLTMQCMAMCILTLSLCTLFECTAFFSSQECCDHGESVWSEERNKSNRTG